MRERVFEFKTCIDVHVSSVIISFQFDVRVFVCRNTQKQASSGLWVWCFACVSLYDCVHVQYSCDPVHVLALQVSRLSDFCQVVLAQGSFANSFTTAGTWPLDFCLLSWSQYWPVVRALEFKSEDPGFDPLAGQAARWVFYPTESTLNADLFVPDPPRVHGTHTHVCAR